MKQIFGASWRTTLIGYAAAIGVAVWPLIETGTFDFHKDWPMLVKGAAIALFGRFVKDHNVTGGGKEAPAGEQ